MRLVTSASLAVMIAGTSALAHAATQPAAENIARSVPQPLAVPHDVPVARDIAYPGTIRLSVDATDVQRAIFRVREVIPVAAAGRLTMLYPEWLPGHHAPRGPVDDVAGIRFTANGRVLEWKRDPVNVYALHVDVPQGVSEVTLDFEYLSPTATNQGRVVMTPDMLNLQWNLVAFYPAGYFVRDIPVQAAVKLPQGWHWAGALNGGTADAAGQISFQPVPFETLIDSPLFAGRYYRREQLTRDVALNIFGDTADELKATPEQIQKHRNLVEQAVKLFGAQHYDHYEFLLALSDKLGGIGLEHHRSSENNPGTGYFTKWDDKIADHNLLPHEYTHSWNGKYRRGADLVTPDYATPMRNSKLWVYEGQTQFWGYVLQARSGIVSKEDTLGAYAAIAASLENRPGRLWRPLIDTVNDPIMAARRPQPWVSQQRSEDYYNEGLLVWLDVDAQIRALTGGRRSIDDFARAFFGKNDRDWGISTYDMKDIVTTLNAIAPHDWNGFLTSRVDRIAAHAPLQWVERGGYRLSWSEKPTNYWKSVEKDRKINDLSYSIGIVIGKDDMITGVMWDSPAFQAGLTVGTKLLAVNGIAYDADAIKSAIGDAKTSKQPIALLVKQGDRFRTADINWQGGLRYPRLEKTGHGDGALDRLLAPLK